MVHLKWTPLRNTLISYTRQVVALLLRGNSVCFVHSSTELTSAPEWVPSAPSPSSFCTATRIPLLDVNSDKGKKQHAHLQDLLPWLLPNQPQSLIGQATKPPQTEHARTEIFGHILFELPNFLVKMCYVMHRSGFFVYKAALCLTQWQPSSKLLASK